MSKSLLKTLALLALAAAVAGGYVYWPTLNTYAQNLLHPHASAPVASAKPAAPATPQVHFAPALTLDLPAAIDQGLVQAEFTGNGRETLRANITNKRDQAVRLHMTAGLVFQGGNGSVVLVRAHDVDLKAGELKQEELQTAATSSSNQVVDAAYSLTLNTEPKLATLLDYAAKHPELSPAALQTTVLALKENLPASAFAKFAEAGSTDMPSKYDTTAFKVDVADIIGALEALRDIGIPDAQLALTIDPQLKIEAMIDPLAHAEAKKYYGITDQAEWTYWKHELLEGDPSTRHYALYGIARFYPDVALQMLPGWARETHTNPVYRISAVQALAETQREEAVPILRQIEHDFGMLTDIGKTAHNAADILESRLAKSAASKVVFHTTATAVPGQLAAVQ
ncbi:MAG TPA: hypothetical protein VG733_13140 [Chthoniobacteraceae bacterium]|nr:hypothetical protein [Chthoniobacteraceae bacterium]